MKKIYKVGLLLFGSIFSITMITAMCFALNNKNDNDNEKQYILSSYIDNDVKEEATVNIASLCLAYEYTPQKMYDLSTDIAIIKIISEDYMDPNASILGMTFGKMLINNTISGNLKEGRVVTYEKPGGYVDMATYDASRPKASSEKRRYLREKAGINTDMNNEYINILADSDIELEVGKTYFAYLTYNSENNAYEIIGLGNGLREVNIPQESKSVMKTNLNYNELKIKNNITGEWESLDTYVKQSIKSLEENK